MKCPDCSGEGRVFAHINRGPAGSSFGWLNCIRCKATGVVPDEQAAWIEAGKRMRADRLSRDLSLFEEAKRLGIRSSELSAIERGMRPAPTVSDFR